MRLTFIVSQVISKTSCAKLIKKERQQKQPITNFLELTTLGRPLLVQQYLLVKETSYKRMGLSRILSILGCDN